MTKHPRTLTAISALIATGVALGACSSVKDESVEDAVRSERTTATDRLEQMKNVKAPEGPVNVRHHKDIWLGSTGARSRNGRPLPARFEGGEGFSLYSAKALTLAEIGDEITALTGIPVTLDNQIAGVTGSDTVDFVGSLSGFLNQIAARRDVSWRHANGVIHFYGIETRTFHVAAPPLRGELTSEFASTNGGAATSAESGAESGNASSSGYGVQATYDIWADLEASIENLLADRSATFSMNPQTGTVTVTGAGADLLRVEDFIKEQNEVLGTRIALNLHVLTIDMSKVDNSSFNFDALLGKVGDTITTASLGNLFGSGVGSALVGLAEENGAEATAGLQQSILDSSSETGANVTFGEVDVDNGNADVWAGKAIIELTKDLSAVSLVDHLSMVTTSAQPAPFQGSKQRNFVEKSEVTTDGEAGTSVSISPGTLTTGFSVTATPRILSPGEMMITYNTAISDLVDMPTFTASGSSVQLPEIDTRAYMQTLRARSGQSIVVAAFEQTQNRTSDGLGITSKNAGTEKTRSATVILLTPTILDDNDQLTVNR